jgi:uncharacterized integral membrane protein
MKFKTVVVIVFVALVTIFSLQNTEVTDVKFLFWKLSISRVLIILGSFIVGALVGVLLSITKKKIFKN